MWTGGKGHAAADLPPGKRLGTHCIRARVGHRPGLDRYGKSRPIRIRFPGSPAHSDSLNRLHQNSVWTDSLSHTCHKSRPSHLFKIKPLRNPKQITKWRIWVSDIHTVGDSDFVVCEAASLGKNVPRIRRKVAPSSSNVKHSCLSWNVWPLQINP